MTVGGCSGRLTLWPLSLGVGPGPDNWQDHTREILLEKFCVNAVVGLAISLRHWQTLRLTQLCEGPVPYDQALLSSIET